MEKVNQTKHWKHIVVDTWVREEKKSESVMGWRRFCLDNTSNMKEQHLFLFFAHPNEPNNRAH